MSDGQERKQREEGGRASGARGWGLGEGDLFGAHRSLDVWDMALEEKQGCFLLFVPKTLSDPSERLSYFATTVTCDCFSVVYYLDSELQDAVGGRGPCTQEDSVNTCGMNDRDVPSP